MKTIMGLAMQEQEERTKVLKTKIDNLTKKFVIYVEVVHHCWFITRDSPQYTVIKRKSMTKVHYAIEGTPSIKKESAGASMSRPNSIAQQEGSTQETPISLDNDLMTTNQE